MNKMAHLVHFSYIFLLFIKNFQVPKVLTAYELLIAKKLPTILMLNKGKLPKIHMVFPCSTFSLKKV